MEPSSHFQFSLEQTLRAQKHLAEQAMAQLTDEDLHWTPHPESNSIAIIVKHTAGNMRSRWTDFLTTDGEKPDRNRDGEFIDTLDSREAVLQCWEEGWQTLFGALSDLQPRQLLDTVVVGGKEQSAAQALLGQLGHYAQHVGQIVYIAKLRLGDRWSSVSIPRTRT